MKRNNRWESLFVVISTMVMISLYFLVVPFLEFVELKAWDLHFKQRGAVQPSGKVAFVTIDEESVNQEGRWPWPRRKIAQLLKTVQASGARVIGLDMGFFEEDLKLAQHAIWDIKTKLQSDPSFAAGSIINRLDALAENEDDDVILSTTIKQSSVPIVLGNFFYFDKNAFYPPSPPSEVLDKVKLSAVRIIQNPPAGYLNEAVGMEVNIPVIEQATPYMGNFNMFADPDGTVRWMPLVIRYENRLFPSLALETLKAGFPENPVIVSMDYQGIERINFGAVSVPTNNRGEFLVNHYGSAYLFPHFSAVQIMRREAPADSLKDRIIIIGNTTEGLHDKRPTPFFPAFPGVEIHCAVIENILNQQFLNRSDRIAPILDAVAITTAGIVFLLLSFIWQGILPLTAVMTILMGSFIGITHLAFINYGTWLNHVYPVCNLLLCYSGISASRFLREEREKRRIRKTFKLYVNPSVVEEILEHPERIRLGGEKKELSVLFSDVRGFTSLSEKIPPEELVPQLNEYLTRMTHVVFERNGTLDKYIGDGIMAIFGAPLTQEDHSCRACDTALDMIKSLEALQDSWRKQGKPILHIGIGINTGWMVVGNIGSERRLDYTVLGDNVNLASRLEGLTKRYGVSIIASEATWESVNHHFVGRVLDVVGVKGKERPVSIFQIMGRISELANFAEPLDIYRMGLENYRNRNWSEALTLFEHVEDWWPDDPPSRIYQQRCKDLLANPPGKDWSYVAVDRRQTKGTRTG
jgi:adenylate cyclase